MTRRASVLIADDHGVVGEALGATLERWFRVVAVVDTLEAIPGALREHAPSAAVVDLSFGESSALRVLPRLVRDFPNTAFIVLTAHPEEVLVDNALRAGVLGYVVKQSAPAELRVAIEEALEGRRYVTPLVRPPSLGSEVVPAGLVPEPEAVSLSDRQVQILQLMREGMTYREIADTMGLSTKTIEYHINLLRSKLGLSKTAQLVRWAEATFGGDLDASAD